MSDDLSDDQRARVIRDLLCHKAEEAEAGGDIFEREDIQEWALWLEQKPPEELRSIWNQHVGEWLASRDDVGPSDEPEMDFDDWLDAQYQALLEGRETAYGYVLDVEITPDILEDFADAGGDQ